MTLPHDPGVSVRDIAELPPRWPLPVPRRDWALFLDVDGTLLDIAPTPETVVVPTGLAAILTDLAVALKGAVAIVSGRSIGDIDCLFPSFDLPVAGQHGAEMRVSRSQPIESMSGRERLDAVRGALAALAGSVVGARVEDKGLSLAVHYRGAPARGPYLRDGVTAILRDRRDALDLVDGKMVLEVKPKAVDKGVAVSRFMASAAFAGRVPVFIGDDVTDQDGFAAALAAGGHAIQVGGERVKGERHWLGGPVEVRDWLRGVALALLHRPA